MPFEGLAKRVDERVVGSDGSLRIIKGARWTGKIMLVEKDLDLPRKWKPTRVFVNSMSDLFHPGVPEDYILKVFKVMHECPSHWFQVLTKRPERLLAPSVSDPGRRLADILPWAPHVWMGVSVEDAPVVGRIDELREIPAYGRFISFEPLIGDVGDVNLDGIGWCIVGGESGNKLTIREMKFEWARALHAQCTASGVPFFMKQLGAVQAQRLLGGRCKGDDLETWPSFLDDLKVHEWPVVERH